MFCSYQACTLRPQSLEKLILAFVGLMITVIVIIGFLSLLLLGSSGPVSVVRTTPIRRAITDDAYTRTLKKNSANRL